MLIIMSKVLLIAVLLVCYVEYIHQMGEQKENFCELKQFVPVLLVFGLAVVFMCWLCTDERNKIYDYKAELKSGEVIKANDCTTSDDDVSTCVIKIDDGEDKEYIVTSYERNISFERTVESLIK